MGKGEGDERYLSVAEVRTLFTERRLPRPDQRAAVGATARARAACSRKLVKAAAAIVALAIGLIVLFAEFPGLFRPLPVIGETGAACASGARPGESGLLARPELVNR